MMARGSNPAMYSRMVGLRANRAGEPSATIHTKRMWCSNASSKFMTLVHSPS